MGPKTKRNLRIAKLCAGGATYQSVGDIYGVTRERVRQIIAVSDLPRAKRPRTDPHDPSLMPRARELWELTELSAAEIARALSTEERTLTKKTPLLDWRIGINSPLDGHQ
jgi:hypothetical protein